jgi:hypothetical protein
VEPIPERASLPVPANPMQVLFIGDVGQIETQWSGATLCKEPSLMRRIVRWSPSVFIAFDLTSATPLRTKATVGTPFVTRCILLYTIRIGTHKNTRTTTIGTQALVETPILSATRFAGSLQAAGWLSGFPAACLFQGLSHSFHRWCLHLC